MEDISTKLRVKDLDSNELRLIIESEIGNQHHDPRGEFTGKYEVRYGDKLSITYKRQTNTIIKIKADMKTAKSEIESIIKKIDDYLINNKGELDYPSLALFVWGSTRFRFKYQDKFQLFPAPEGNPLPEEESALYPMILQYSYLKTGLPWLDALRKSKKELELVNLLSTLCTTILGIKLIDHIGTIQKKYWVFPTFSEMDELETPIDYFPSKWCQVGFSYPPISNESYFEIQESSYTHPNFSRLINIIDEFYSLPKEQQDIVINACYWYHKGLVTQEKTDSLLYFVIMIESLLPTESKCECGEIVSHKKNQCPNCNSCFSGLLKTFKAFMNYYAGIEDTVLLNNIYNLRSNITHAGLTINGEGKGFIPGISPTDFIESRTVDLLEQICSQIIGNYINAKACEH